MYQSDELQWQVIDELEVQALPFIDVTDHCFYYLNRSSGGYSASHANSRINDFKKPLDRFANRPDVLWYKEYEIDAFAQDLSKLLTGELSQFCQAYDVALVPINTSRPLSDEYYDDRLVRLCSKTVELVGNVRLIDCMHSRQRIQSAHEGGPRDYDTLSANLEFNGFGSKIPDVVILVDDVLTQGVHYAVCRDAIRSTYVGGVLIVGAFLSIHRSMYIGYESYGISY